MNRRPYRLHGESRSREYRVWAEFKSRCYNPNATGFKHYGGRGISVCPEWRFSFTRFLEDMGRCPAGFSIDRIDTDGDYCPSNCRWVDKEVQANNRTCSRLLTLNGETLSVSQWARKLGGNKWVIFNRLRAGWTTERVLSVPVKTS